MPAEDFYGFGFKAGDPRPDGYIARSEWAEAQIAAGVKAKHCKSCGRWRFPQEPPCCSGAAGAAEGEANV